MRGMGLMDSWVEAAYGTHSVTRDGNYRWMPAGSMKRQARSVRGAVAAYEAGSVTSGRTTLTRVAAGAVVAGPIGAVVGGMFKKDTSRGYVTVTFPDQSVIVVDGPLRDEPKMRRFVQRINELATRT